MQHHERKSKSPTFWGASWSTPAGISQRSPPPAGPREGRPTGRGRSTGKCTNFPPPKPWICWSLRQLKKWENTFNFSGGLEWMATKKSSRHQIQARIPIFSPTIPLFSPSISIFVSSKLYPTFLTVLHGIVSISISLCLQEAMAGKVHLRHSS